MDDVIEKVEQVFEDAVAKAKADQVSASMKRVAVLPWPEMENCYLCLSGKRREQKQYGERFYAQHEEHLWKVHEDRIKSEPYISFAYAERGIAAEWNGAHGPIQLWFRCEADHKGDGWMDEPREHWLWPHAYGAGMWSQLAVDESDLPRRFNEGDWSGIFNVLKLWVRSRLETRDNGE